MDEERTRGQIRQDIAANNRDISASSGWVTTQQAARALDISPRTVRWHIEQGNLEAKPQGEGVRRAWLVSIDSLQAFRSTRQHATNPSPAIRESVEHADIAPDMHGNPIRELADRLAEEAARAAEYRVRLELTEQAQSSLESVLADERQSREKAERERDELRSELEALQETLEATDTAARGTERGDVSPEPQEPSDRRSWLYRVFFGP